ncbi:TPA: hypothetical protein QH074_004303 [Enterobacter hormaechei subsp. steigerwaltii]|nr:hypothetical protein [Enterobacter hormaechei subsp. steigerwaltii]
MKLSTISAIALLAISLSACSSEASRIAKCHRELGASVDACMMKIQREDEDSARRWERISQNVQAQQAARDRQDDY